jgi:hypothetical protein
MFVKPISCFWKYLKNTIWNLPESPREGDLWEWGYGGGIGGTHRMLIESKGVKLPEGVLAF